MAPRTTQARSISSGSRPTRLRTFWTHCLTPSSREFSGAFGACGADKRQRGAPPPDNGADLALNRYLPAVGRFLIVVTFLEDALRILTQWSDQLTYLHDYRKSTQPYTRNPPHCAIADVFGPQSGMASPTHSSSSTLSQ